MTARYVSRLLLIAALLGGCASTPPAMPSARQQLGEFSLAARFALRAQAPNGDPESLSGRLHWQHENAFDRITLANPLGHGVAEIVLRPGRAELTTADGQQRSAADATDLIEQLTGQRLPLTRLPGWLVGRAADDGRMRTDALGRPSRLNEAGWQIDYGYDDERPEAAASRLTLHDGGHTELRLRIETWENRP